MHQIDMLTGEVTPVESKNTEVIVTGEVVDADGSEIEKLHDLLFWAIFKWEKFLRAEGLAI